MGWVTSAHTSHDNTGTYNMRGKNKWAWVYEDKCGQLNVRMDG